MNQILTEGRYDFVVIGEVTQLCYAHFVFKASSLEVKLVKYLKNNILYKWFKNE